MPVKTKSKPTQKSSGKTGNPVVWVEVPVIDIERAKKFYTGLFGFKFQMHTMEDYNMAMFSGAPDSYGCGGALIQGETYVPSYDGSVVYFHVKDIEGTLRKAEEMGGEIVQEKKSIGQYGFIGYFEDTEGNRIALHSMT